MRPDDDALPVVRAADLDEPDPARRWLIENLWTRAGVGRIGSTRGVQPSTSLLGAAHRGRLPTPGGPGLARWPLPGECRVASIRLEAQAPPPRGPSPILDPRYAVSCTQGT